MTLPEDADAGAAALAADPVPPGGRDLLLRLPVPAFVIGPGAAGPAFALANPAFLALTGLSEDDLIGRGLDLLRGRSGEPAAWNGLLEAAAAGAPAEAELLCTRGDGATFWGAVRIVPLREGPADGGVLGQMLGQIVDVSRRVDLEGALQLSLQREALGLLTNSVAHEFNNFLQILIGYVDGLKRRLGDRPEPFVQRAVTRSTEAAERAAVLTRQLLAHSRRIAPDLRPCDLDALVAGRAGPLRRGLPRGVSLSLRASPGLPPALCNPTQVELVLTHLVANAAEAMMAAEGGADVGGADVGGADVGGADAGAPPRTIEIASFAVAAGDRSLARPADGAVGLAISDTGHGMSPEMLTRALAPFATSREAGRGVGLAVVHSLMKRQNGTISLDSRPGEGTTVRLVFPAAPRDARAGPA